MWLIFRYLVEKCPWCSRDLYSASKFFVEVTSLLNMERFFLGYTNKNIHMLSNEQYTRRLWTGLDIYEALDVIRCRVIMDVVRCTKRQPFHYNLASLGPGGNSYSIRLRKHSHRIKDVEIFEADLLWIIPYLKFRKSSSFFQCKICTDSRILKTRIGPYFFPIRRKSYRI